MEPEQACNCSMQRVSEPGLPRSRSPSEPVRTATWSEPMTQASGCCSATAAALALARRVARVIGRSPLRPVSSTPGALQEKGRRSLARSSRRYFEVEAKIREGGDFKNNDLHSIHF